jgi:bifunctional enzyme CysN/CysC
VLPSGKRTRIKRIETADGELESAAPPMSVSILLEDDIDISRGDMLCRPHNQPTVANELDAMICWMTDTPIRQGRRYLLKHTTRTVKTIVDDLRYRIDVNSLHRDQDAPELGLNEIGRIRLRTSSPLLLDEYDLSRTTGGFVLIDETTFDTVGAGMVLRAGPEEQQVPEDDNLEALAA